MAARALILLFALLTAGACATPPERIRVLTYNIHHGEGTDGVFDLERLADVIRRAKPDLVALQEVDVRTGRAGGVDQPAQLAELTGLAGFFGEAMPYDGGSYGEAVLHAFDAAEIANHALPHATGAEPRAALEVLVLRGGSGPRFRFVATHLDHLREVESRDAQVRELDALFGQDDLPTILAGDLNATPGSAEMRFLFDRWQASGLGHPTFPSHAPERKIDYVLFRPKDRWRVVEARVIDEPVASDHSPLLVVLELLP